MTNSRRSLRALAFVALAIWLAGTASAGELDGPVTVYYDFFDVPTIVATTEHDAIYMQG